VTNLSGTERTKRFYEERGWKEEDGASVDRKLFGVKEDGPIRIRLYRLHMDRVRAGLSSAGAPLNLLECGCGGNPDRQVIDLCSRYTGVDFSEVGLDMARASFADVGIPHEFRAADVCHLPFPDATFDAVYSAHMIYHIEDPRAQEAALAEFLRVVRPGGTVVLVAANPRPLAFPIRLVRRILADLPVFGPLFNKARAKSPIPYKPMPIGWMRQRLMRGGNSVSVVTYAIPSTTFNQKVTEYEGLGKLVWKGIQWLDVNCPRLSAYLGNYVIYVAKKADVTR
jgi:SAM-dependent methyltransferase